MIQANCRARFTAADFEFIMKALGRSGAENICLSELLTDEEARDTILDHERLVDAVLNSPGRVSISPQLYFYILIRHVLKNAGCDRKMCDYLASLLETFSRTARLYSSCGQEYGYISDLLVALETATSQQAFMIRSHVGDYSLFISGIFHENVERRRQRGAPDVSFYEEVGRMNYHVAAGHSVARARDLSETFGGLAERFHEVRLAFNRLSEELLNIDDDQHVRGLLS